MFLNHQDDAVGAAAMMPKSIKTGKNFPMTKSGISAIFTGYSRKVGVNLLFRIIKQDFIPVKKKPEK